MYKVSGILMHATLVLEDGTRVEGAGFRVSHVNLNDNTVEGMKHEKLPFSSVQYHPEAHPGPHDNEYLFDEFLKSIGE